MKQLKTIMSKLGIIKLTRITYFRKMDFLKKKGRFISKLHGPSRTWLVLVFLLVKTLSVQ